MHAWFDRRIILSVIAAGAFLAAVAVVMLQPARSVVWIGVMLFGLGAVASASSLLLVRKQKECAFQSRPALTDEQIYRSYFSDAGLPQSIVLDLWHEVALALKVPPEKLQPSDRFGKELGGYLITSEDLDTLAEIAAARARKFSVIINLESIATLGDYVHKLAAIERGKWP